MIGNRIKEKRLELGTTQAEIAQRIGVSPQYYGQFERNEEVPSLQKLLDIAGELNCSIEYLLSGGGGSLPPIKQNSGRYLKNTGNGWACTAKVCPWRDQTGFCNSGAGCLKEWEESRKNG